MKIGVLFWGFKDLNLAAECANLLKKDHGIKEFYIQISPQEKTISLLDIFPEEIIRSDFDDLNFFYKWLSRNHKKNIIIVMDFWTLLSKKNFSSNLEVLKKIFDEPFHFLICCPKIYHDPILDINQKKLINIVDKTFDYFKNVQSLYEISLNSSASLTMLSYPPNIDFLNSMCGQDFFIVKKFNIFRIIPSILIDFPSVFISKTLLLNEIKKKIIDFSELFQSVKSKKEGELLFKNILKGDVLNSHYRYENSKKKKYNGFLILSSIERFYNLSSKEDTKFLLWLVYLAIMDHEVLNRIEEENEKSSSILFSSIPV